MLGQHTAYCLPIGVSVSEWSGALVTLVFPVQFLGSDAVDYNEAVRSDYYCPVDIGIGLRLLRERGFRPESVYFFSALTIENRAKNFDTDI